MTRKYTLTMKPENLNSFLTGKPLFIKPKAIISREISFYAFYLGNDIVYKINYLSLGGFNKTSSETIN